MSDFDAVLERLLNEPSFAVALAADAEGTLAGYRLDADETELLRSQVSADSGGGQAAVETRTNKSSTFGLFSSVAEVGHGLSGGGATGAGAGALGHWSEFGSAAGAVAYHGAGSVAYHGAGASGVHGGAAQGLGDAPSAQGLGDAPSGQGLGDAPTAWGSGGGAVHEPFVPAGQSGFGDAPGHDGGPDLDGLPPAGASGLGDAPQSGLGGSGQSGLGGSGQFTAEPEHYAVPAGYHPRIDADGDGHWDKATYVGTKDDGVEIRVDLNHDGHADFVGHDTDSDGRVDYADIDKDHDGVFEKRMYDDNGDGWLDRTVWNEH
jgi:hypothetical protein